MTTETATPEIPTDDPEVAFAAMARKLAGLTAAIDGFAARQQEIHARDYTDDLVAIREKHEQVRQVLRWLTKRSWIELEQEGLTEILVKASAEARAADHQALAATRRGLNDAIATIGSMLASARTEAAQTNWLIGVAAGTAILGTLFGTIVPTAIDRMAPAGWHWPERGAAHLIGLDTWNAGADMMQVADPARWQEMVDAIGLTDRNTEVIANCRRRAAQHAAGVACTVAVGG